MRLAASVAFALATIVAGCQGQRSEDALTTGSIATASRPASNLRAQDREGAVAEGATPGPAQAFVTFANASPMDAATPAAYAGTWTISDGETGRTCSVELNSQPHAGTYGAWTRLCSSDELFGVQRWQGGKDGLVLLDLSGEARATLERVAPDRFDGTLAPGGARISMWR